VNPLSDKLSAFLDGELSANEMRVIEDALAQDPALQAELDALMAADVLAQEEFAAQLDAPVPLELAAAIRSAPMGEPPADEVDQSVSPRFGWALAASFAALALIVGGLGGYAIGTRAPEQVAVARGWLDDIADYHEVYAAQKRHLVEVPASEADHIQTWLTAEVGTDVIVPDLSDHGLTFQGARLLVAAGKPVAQLVFTDADERVVALCAMGASGADTAFAEQNINGLTLVSWGGGDAKFVVVGDEGRGDLGAIAERASVQI